ncbi:alkaline phosphatase family protein [Sulfuracidifex tepidarius]|uniref:alkaline phosphatase family protein n=1 Tax=Sulfuracidifex tepidarius TaxID=1294262 RepID=UPI002729B6A2|nr:alkaline phosphatase family protein [Sulfuracidifex tepidarius]
MRQSLPEKRFAFFYLPYVDTVSHHYGPSSPETAETVREVSKIAKKAMEIGKSNGFTVVLTSDHGQIDVEKNVDISRDQEILDNIEVPPFGDSRNLMIISRHDVSETFKKYETYIFGKETLSKYAGGNRVPDYAVVPKGRTTLNYWIDDSMDYKGNHGGISKDEMEIPLCVT